MPRHYARLRRHGGTDGSDWLADRCQTQPGRQVQRFEESALRFAPAQLSRDHLDQWFAGFGHATAQDDESRINGLSQDLYGVADGAHYHVQHIDGLGLPLFRATNQVGHRRVGVGPQTPHGCARADCFQASVLPARALEAMRFDWDMADFAGRAAIAMHQHAVFDNARSQSGAEVQERNGTGHAICTAQHGGRRRRR